MSEFFYKLNLQINAHEEYDISSFIISLGALGTSEVLSFSQDNLQYDPHLVPTKLKKIDFYFDFYPTQELLDRIKSHFHIYSLEISKEPYQDWLKEWKKSYQPFILTDSYWIVPSWIQSPVDQEFSIYIDPGMAFGTGTHSTTKMAAHFLYQISQLFNQRESLLDIGTGTGILSILAEKLDFKLIEAIDTDLEACRVARENINLNQCRQIVVTHCELKEINQKFNVVVANIIDGVLLKLKNLLQNKVLPKGYLILSGILLENEDSFLLQFHSPEFELIDRIESSDGWIALLYQKK